MKLPKYYIYYLLDVRRRVPKTYYRYIKYLLASIRGYYKIIPIVLLNLLLVEEAYRINY